MKFTTPLIKGRLVERYKRFFADIELDNGKIITAHCANTGSMAGLKDPGNPVWVSPVDNPKRKLKYDWHMVEVGSALVGIHTHAANKIVEEALKENHIQELLGYDSIRREVKYGQNSRIDFLLQDKDKPDCYVEIKSITYSRTKGLAEFPDSPTARGTKHLVELSHMAQDGARAVMLYLVQRADCNQFRIADDIDPEYQSTLIRAKQSGVESLAYACALSPLEISLSHAIKSIE
ncbi:MAG TPA: DNA/RNA nuclease SfsA [Hellea balneolensis]|uniref:Sugar fermentation stimulation protein homolog n=1 Tax=Hellea balneolensis TaxID=287478 RepID=A0A7C3GCQ5_9PROT|nr:DNA/RNA nuclease SfsA [Hellea balneolensis]